MYVRNINYVKYPSIEDGAELIVKIRYKHAGELATVFNDDGNLKVLFHIKFKELLRGNPQHSIMVMI